MRIGAFCRRFLSSQMSISNKSFQVFSLTWPDVSTLLTQVIPPLAPSEHKGSLGRIGVVGGSSDYCGAPFFAADAALKLGGDLSTVFCSQSAAIPIKSYSPDIMVTPFYEDRHVHFFSYEQDTTCSNKNSQLLEAKERQESIGLLEVHLQPRSVCC
jgi:hypothetical protein